MVRIPPLNWLRVFEAVARNSSVSLGARELNVTTSAASQSVKRLEATLNATLLAREGKGVRLSEAGERLAAQLADVFAEIEEAVAPFAPRKPGHVDIRAPRGFARCALAPLLAEINADSPHRARLATAEQGGADIEVVRATAAPAGGAWVGRDMMLAVCAPDYRAPDRAPTLLQGPRSTALWAQWLAADGAPRWEAAQRVAAPSEAACLEAARLGLGYALSRSYAAAEALAREAVIAPFATRIPAPDSYWAIARSDNASTRHVFEKLVARLSSHGDAAARRPPDAAP